MKERLIGLILTFAMLMSFVPIIVQASTSGSCGDNLTWTIDYEGTLIISGKGDMYNWDYDGSPWFSNRKDIKTIIIENGIASIGDYAFWDCSSLTRVTISDSVTSIGEWAFSDSGLTSITIPRSMTIIGDHAFRNCSSLTSITISDSVTSIGFMAFYHCINLADVYYSGNYADVAKVKIGDNNSCLTGIPIHCNDFTANSWGKCGDTVAYFWDDNGTLTITGIGDMYNWNYGKSPWYSNNQIKTVNIDNGITNIGHYAFQNCDSLRRIILPDSLMSIGYASFWGCSGLDNVTIPKTVTEIGAYAFRYCTSLTKIKIPEGVTDIDGFDECINLSSVEMPSSATKISTHAFRYCYSLKNIQFPENITFISEDAFRGCTGLTHIELPDAIKTLDWRAFRDCSNLISIAIPNTIERISYNVFENCDSLAYIYYSGSEEEWRRINIDSQNQCLKNAFIFYNSGNLQYDDDPPGIGQYNPNNLYILERYDSLIETNKYLETDETDLSYLNHTTDFKGDCWWGDVVWVEYKQDNLGSNVLLKVYPVTEHHGTVQNATEKSLMIDGIKYNIGDNIAPLSFANGYLGEVVSFYTYNNKIVGFSTLKTQDNDYYTICEYDPEYKCISIVSSLINPVNYYISQYANIADAEVDELGRDNVSFIYDDFNNIYNISRKARTEYSYYDTYKPSTWDEVESASNEFINAANDYMNGVIELMNKQEDEEKQRAAARHNGALKMMEEDAGTRSKILSFGSIQSEDIKVYAYEALYDTLEEARENADVNLGDIKFSGNLIKNNTAIVKKITDAFSSVKFTRIYGNYAITVDMMSFGFGGVLADFGSMTIRENGRQLDIVTICSSEKDAEQAMSIYFEQLKLLAENSVVAAASEVVKALSGKSIADWNKWGIKSVLNKFAPEIKIKGAGDLSDAVTRCIDTYKSINKIVKSRDKSTEKKVEIANDVYSTAVKNDLSDKSITDEVIKKLYDSMSSKLNTLRVRALSYAQDTEVEEKSFFDWFASFKCPVNVYVYDKSGSLVGYVEDWNIEYNDDILIEKSGDVKKVYLPNFEEYDIRLIATDVGKLNCTIEQFDNGAPIGRANFYNINLYENKELIFECNISNISDEHENLSITTDKTIITPDEYFNSYDDAAVMIFGQISEGGDIIGVGSYAKGDGVNLTAIAEENYSFKGWYIDTELVSTSPTYTLCAMEDMIVKADFSPDYTTAVTDFTSSGNKTTINAVISNNTDYELDAKVYVAVYDENNELCAVSISDVTIDANADMVIETVLDYTLEASDKIKVFLWEDKMIPLANFVELKL